MRLALFILGLAILAACARPLPRHPWTDAPTALATMRARGEAIASVSSACGIVLRSPRSSIRLDGAMAAELPGRFRVRAWKLGAPVLDLALNDDGIWLMLSERASGDSTAALDLITQERLTRAWAVITGAALADGQVLDGGGPSFRVATPEFTAEIDRDTLTIRRIEFPSDGGSLTLDRYALFGDAIVYPRRILAEHEKGSIEFRLDDPAFNEAIDPIAFKPPRSAVRRP